MTIRPFTLDCRKDPDDSNILDELRAALEQRDLFDPRNLYIGFSSPAPIRGLTALLRQGGHPPSQGEITDVFTHKEVFEYDPSGRAPHDFLAVLDQSINARGVIVIYDGNHFVPVEDDSETYQFRHPHRRTDAIRAVINILLPQYTPS